MNLINNKNNMNQETVERIIDETVDTLIDSIDESTVDYMFEF